MPSSSENLINIEAEQAVLGVLLLSNTAFLHCAQLKAGHFYEPLHRDIFVAMLDHWGKGKHFSPVTMRAQFDDHPALTDIGGGAYLGKMAAQAASVMNVVDYVDLLVDQSQRRALVEVCSEAAHAAQSLDKRSPIEMAADFSVKLQDAVSDFDSSVFQDDYEVTESILSELKRDEHPIPTGYGMLDTAMEGGLYPGKSYGFAARKKMGKAQPLDAQVLTKSGWKRMGDIKVGEHLASPDGSPSHVTGVHPQGKKAIFRVTFSDGRTTECCGDHLWEVYGYRDKGREIINTMELQRRSKLSLPTYIPLYEGEHGWLDVFPIDPYVLGVLLGDGGIRHQVILSSADQFIIEKVGKAIPEHMELRHISQYDWGIRNKKGEFIGSRGRKITRAKNKNDMKEKLKELGLLGRGSHDKFIPEKYMNAEKKVRLEVLRGLIDTDGWMHDHGVEIVTVSELMAAQIVELVRSVGGLCSIKVKYPYAVKDGWRTPGQTAYRCKIRHTDTTTLAYLPRKLATVTSSRKNGCRLTIKKVELIGLKQAQCISVSHRGGLYVTDNYIVTHNTILAGSISHNLNQRGVRHLFICGEMSPAEIQKRTLARVLHVEQRQFRGRDARTAAFMQRIADKALQSKRAVIFKNAPGLTFEDLKRYVLLARMQKKITGFILDYWQLVGGKAKGKSTAEHLDEVAQWIADTCRKYDLWSITMAQINQEGNTRGGEGIRLAFDQVYTLQAPNNDAGRSERWLDMADTRYTAWRSVGSENRPGFYLNAHGPYFSETPEGEEAFAL